MHSPYLSVCIVLLACTLGSSDLVVTMPLRDATLAQLTQWHTTFWHMLLHTRGLQSENEHLLVDPAYSTPAAQSQFVEGVPVFSWEFYGVWYRRLQWWKYRTSNDPHMQSIANCGLDLEVR